MSRKKKRKLRVHLCNPPTCTRLTLREKCDRCSAKDACTAALGRIFEPGFGHRFWQS